MRTKYKLLCIEDEIDVRENVAEVLRMEGFEVLEAGDAEEGLKKFMSFKPDMVISDILMPRISGYALLGKIRELPKKYNPQVPFIFLSALGHKADIIKGTSLTANDY
jgi:DNA-binding response OmpR family regulator